MSRGSRFSIIENPVAVAHHFLDAFAWCLVHTTDAPLTFVEDSDSLIASARDHAQSKSGLNSSLLTQLNYWRDWDWARHYLQWHPGDSRTEHRNYQVSDRLPYSIQTTITIRDWLLVYSMSEMTEISMIYRLFTRLLNLLLQLLVWEMYPFFFF